MSIAKRMYLLILVAALGLGGLTILGVVQINRVFTSANYATVNVVPSLIALDETSVAFGRLRVQLWQYIEITDAEKRTQLNALMKEQRSKAIEQIDLYEKEYLDDDTDRAMLKDDRSTLLAFFDLADKTIAMVNEAKQTEAREWLLSKQDVAVNALKALKTHNEYNVAIAKRVEKEASSMLSSAIWQLVLIALLVTGAVAGMGLIIARRLIGSLEEAVQIAQTVASGDLTHRITVTSNDELGQLLQALKEMNDSLIGIVGQVRTGTDTITSASAEIAHGNMELSSRTESQASSLEETAASMEELTSTVKQNADNARQANKLAQTASEVALRGGSVVSEVVQTMGAINESSRRIVDIISVIDGIAFQTNILALNAAVEAARAGEQGRGFAVVASEVRNLAQRSAAAAKEIKELINNSVENVDMGSKLVDQAGTTMDEVVNSIRLVNDIMAEITAASQEQSLGIAQVNDAVIQMDNVTQQNAALVEEAAAAAGSMQDQAKKLTQVVSVFKINFSDQSVAEPTRSRPAATVKPALKSKPKPALKIAARPTPQSSPAAKPAAPAADAGDGWEEF